MEGERKDSQRDAQEIDHDAIEEGLKKAHEIEEHEKELRPFEELKDEEKRLQQELRDMINEPEE